MINIGVRFARHVLVNDINLDDLICDKNKLLPYGLYYGHRDFRGTKKRVYSFEPYFVLKFGKSIRKEYTNIRYFQSTKYKKHFPDTRYIEYGNKSVLIQRFVYGIGERENVVLARMLNHNIFLETNRAIRDITKYNIGKRDGNIVFIDVEDVLDGIYQEAYSF